MEQGKSIEVKISLGGKELGTFDTFNNDNESFPDKHQTYEGIKLKAGDNILRLEYTGMNEAADITTPVLLMDYFLLEKQ